MSRNVTRDAEKLELLFELSRAFGSLMDLDELLPLVNARTKEVLEAESCALLLLDETGRQLFFPVSSDLTPEVESRLRDVRFPVDSSIAGRIVQTGKTEIIADVKKDPRFYPGVDEHTGAQTHGLLYAPLRTHDGVIGVIGLRNKRKGNFTADDLSFLDALAGSIAVAIENARLYAQVKASEERLRAEVSALRRDLAQRDRFTEIVGNGPAMTEVFRLMESAAASPIAVLIEGETGTGKELVARGIHRESERSAAPFLAINCAAFTETLLESELFGHRRGSFTGATQDKRGLFEAATGGTLFLDEVGEMPLVMQVKLLRVLQEGEIIPVGDTRSRKVDVRLISATNRDLRAEIGEGRFREDLYFRLAAFPIRLPPLRERPEDIPLLADRMIATVGERHRKRVAGIEPAALELLVGFDWPGNVRELQNEIERAVALGRDGGMIGATQLSSKLHAASGRGVTASAILAGTLAETAAREPEANALRRGRAEFEARYIGEVLKQSGGNVSRAARKLGMSRVTLHKKIKEYGLR